MLSISKTVIALVRHWDRIHRKYYWHQLGSNCAERERTISNSGTVLLILCINSIPLVQVTWPQNFWEKTQNNDETVTESRCYYPCLWKTSNPLLAWIKKFTDLSFYLLTARFDNSLFSMISQGHTASAHVTCYPKPSKGTSAFSLVSLSHICWAEKKCFWYFCESKCTTFGEVAPKILSLSKEKKKANKWELSSLKSGHFPWFVLHTSSFSQKYQES